MFTSLVVEVVETENAVQDNRLAFVAAGFAVRENLLALVAAGFADHSSLGLVAHMVDRRTRSVHVVHMFLGYLG